MSSRIAGHLLPVQAGFTVRQVRGQRLAAAGQPRLHRSRGRPRLPGDLVHRQPDQVVEDDGLAVAGRYLTQRGDDRDVVRAQPARVGGRPVAAVRRAHVRRLPPGADADPVGDRTDPRLGIAVARYLVPALPGPRVGLLDAVLGLGAAPGHGVQLPGEALHAAGVERVEGRGVAHACPLPCRRESTSPLTRTAPHEGCTQNPTIYNRAVPISPFLVTRPARSPSDRSPVPSGRAGRTMYLASDVESQTVISVSGGRVTPNSASTARGSRTVRDR